ncbi:hypothetical protein BDY21DRAFT_335251 [Lineolata rhizophorae]|uniref:Uncharacterized protein n=1 Tax=Lineolata rhizophorae TaxID=578093 RepID=A0A6A6P940_9PEZI|nr:hypothetical protein BDY21DRAFT_335251 [Lineolata rhizophorae]
MRLRHLQNRSQRSKLPPAIRLSRPQKLPNAQAPSPQRRRGDPRSSRPVKLVLPQSNRLRGLNPLNLRLRRSNLLHLRVRNNLRMALRPLRTVLCLARLPALFSNMVSQTRRNYSNARPLLQTSCHLIPLAWPSRLLIRASLPRTLMPIQPPRQQGDPRSSERNSLNRHCLHRSASLRCRPAKLAEGIPIPPRHQLQDRRRCSPRRGSPSIQHTPDSTRLRTESTRLLHITSTLLCLRTTVGSCSNLSRSHRRPPCSNTTSNSRLRLRRRSIRSGQQQQVLRQNQGLPLLSRNLTQLDSLFPSQRHLMACRQASSVLRRLCRLGNRPAALLPSGCDREDSSRTQRL